MSSLINTIKNIFAPHTFKLESMLEKDSKLGSLFIREKMRETNFLSKILPRRCISDFDLDRDVGDTGLPMKVLDKEPGVGAAWIPFYEAMENKYFTGARYQIFFLKVEARQGKRIAELEKSDVEMKQVLADLAVDIQRQEEKHFLKGIDACIAASPTAAEQTLNIPGKLTPSTVKTALTALVNLKRPAGAILMSYQLSLDLLDSSDPYFSTLKDQWWRTGDTSQMEVAGLPIITTTSNTLPNNVFYVFAKPEYLGIFDSILDATLHINQCVDEVDFVAYECVGVGINNIQSIIKVTV